MRARLRYVPIWFLLCGFLVYGQGDTETVTFELLNDSTTFGVDALGSSLTINGVTETPVFRYKGGDADATDWDAWTYGETLTAAGSGGSYNQGSPGLGANDDSVHTEATRYWQASGNSFADVTTEDMVFEAVLQGSSATTVGVSKRAGTGLSGYWFWVTTSGRFGATILNGSGGASVYSAASSFIEGQWYHVIVFIDRSGSQQIYLNGEVSGAAVASVAGSLTIATPLVIGSRSAGALAWTRNIAYAAIWKRDAWLDTHLQADVAQERFQKYLGLYPSVSAGDPLWTSFTRATTAYSDKVEMGDEKIPEPIDFTDAAWTKVRSSVTTATGTTTPGGIQAYNLREDATASNSHYIIDSFTGTIGAVNRYSVDVKANNRDWVLLQITDWTSSIVTYFDVANGVVGNSLGVVDNGILDLGDGWYRCWLDTFGEADVTGNAIILIAEGNGDFTLSGLDQDSLYIANASVKTYERKMYSVGAGWPRVVYRKDVNGADFKGYLSENGVTNLAVDSADFTAVSYTQLDAGDTITANTTVIPTGATEGDDFVADATDGEHGISFTATLITGQHTVSVLAKDGDKNWVYLSDDTVTNAYAYFNVAANTVGATGAGLNQALSEQYGNGLVRCSITFPGTAALHTFKIQSAEADNDKVFAGDGSTVNTTFWGTQVERYSYPTSYIATSGGSAARNQDNLIFKADDGNVANIGIGSVEAIFMARPSSGFSRMPLSIDSASTNMIHSWIVTGGALTTRGFSPAGVGQWDIAGSTSVVDLDTHTWRATWKTDEANQYVDGSQDGVTDTSCSPPTGLTRILPGGYVSAGFNLNEPVKNIRIWDSVVAP